MPIFSKASNRQQITEQLFAACRADNKARLQELYQQNENLYKNEALGNIRNDKGTSLINAAAFNKAIDCIKFLIEQGTNLNQSDYNKNFPFLIALKDKDDFLTRLFLEHGASPFLSEDSLRFGLEMAPQSIIEYTVTRGLSLDIQPRYLEILLSWAVDKKDLRLFLSLYEQQNIVCNEKILCSAIKQGSLYFVKRLIEAGADLYSGNPFSTALHNHHVEIAILLLNQGATNDIEQFSVLYAIKEDHHDLLHSLLTHGSNINFITQTNNGINSPLITAIIYKRFHMLPYLLDYGAELDLTNGQGKTALTYLLQLGELSLAKQFIELDANIHSLDASGANALQVHCDSIYANNDFINYLLSLGLEVNTCDKSGKTALHYARAQAIIFHLLGCGAKINSVDDNGQTALHTAVIANKDLSVIEMLVSHQILYNLKDNDNLSALAYAFTYNRLEIAKYLISIGVEFIGITIQKQPLLIYLAEQGHIEIIHLLLDKGANINQQKSGDTLLIALLNKRDIPSVMAFIKRGAHCRNINYSKRPLLIWAMENRHCDLAAVMIEHGAIIHSYNGGNLLHMAVLYPDEQLIKALIRVGVNPLGKDCNQKTPLELIKDDAQKQNILVWINEEKINLTATIFSSFYQKASKGDANLTQVNLFDCTILTSTSKSLF